MKNWLKKLAIIGIALLFIVGCSKTEQNVDKEGEQTSDATENVAGTENENEELESVAELTLDKGCLMLDAGESYQLTAKTEDKVTYSSSNPEVATVDGNGKVTAVAKGNALIVAKNESARGTCGVMVGLKDQKIDIEGMTMTPYKIDLTIARETSVMQSFAIKPDGTLYIIQAYNSTPGDCIVTKVNTDNTQEQMRFVEFGHGNTIAVDWDEQGNDYLWIPSVGGLDSSNAGVSRIEWEADAMYQIEAGETWKSGLFQSNPNCAVDMESGLMVLCQTISQGRKCYIYDLEGFLSGELTEPLHSFIMPTYNSPGQPGSTYLQGFDIDGKYFYTYEGGANELISIHTFDLDGNWLYSRNVEGYADLEYREAEGIQVCNGKIYIGIASGPGYDRKANIFTFE